MENIMNVFLVEVRRSIARLDLPSNLTAPELRSRKKIAMTTVKAVITAWVLCNWRARPRNGNAVTFCRKLYSRVLRDPHAALKDLKGSTNDARWQALRGTHIGRNTRGKLYPKCFRANRRQLYILSCISRALPLGSQRVEEEALADFMKVVTVPAPDLGEEQRQLLDDFCNDSLNIRVCESFQKTMEKKSSINKWSLATGKSTIECQPYSGSACVGYPSKIGGRSAATFAVVGPSKSSLKFSPFFLRADHMKKNYVMKCPKPSPASSEAVGVKERGYKVRIVTLNDPYRVAKAHIYRQELFKRACKAPFTVLGDPPAAIDLSALRDWSDEGRERRWIFSMDLKSATDNISHIALNRVCEFLGIDGDLVHTDFVIDDIPVKRGAFMGMPLSWTILDWTHHFICKKVDSLGLYRHKGDDLIAFWTWNQYRHYKWCLKRFGYKMNVKKTFHSRDMGTFCEALYRLEGKALVLQPTVSVRSLVVASNVDSVSVMSAASQEAYRRGFNMNVFNRALEGNFTREIAILKQRRIPLYLPRVVGGAGLVPSDPNQKLSHFESDWFWGCLDKDMPGIRSNLEKREGPYGRSAHKALSKLKYRSGLKDDETCKHLDAFMIQALRRTSLYDAGISSGAYAFDGPGFDKKDYKKVSPLRFVLRQYSCYRKKVKLAENSGRVSWVFANSVKTKVTRKSAEEVFPHECGEDP